MTDDALLRPYAPVGDTGIDDEGEVMLSTSSKLTITKANSWNRIK